jgi:hypothetical protein
VRAIAEDGKFDAVFAEIEAELARGEIRPL